MDGMKQIGAACFPLMTLILGCNLSAGATSTRVDTPSILMVTLVRLVVTPLLYLGVHRTLRTQGLLPNDPMIHFILLLQPAMPTGMQVAMVAKGAETMKGLGTLLFWQN